MALIFRGYTPCALCGKILLDEDEIRGLPAFVSEGHPLYKYSDAGFHAQCFDAWDRKEEVLHQVEVAKQEFIQSTAFQEMVAKHGWPAWAKKPEA